MHVPHNQAKMTRRAPAAIATVLVLASLLLVACGSSSKTTGTTQSGTAAPTGQKNASRFAALRQCMQKNGITLPARSVRKPSQGRPPSGGAFPPAGAGQLPKGITRARFQAALRTCGGGPGRGGFAGGGPARINSPVFKKALTRFARCMRENGIEVPTPNTSGKGPIFDTKGLTMTSPKFKAAQMKCSSLLRVAPGTPGAAPAPGAPPAPAG